MKIEEEFMLFWDDTEDIEPTELELLEEKLELKDLKRCTDIQGARLRAS